jgi:hypothetical protein
VWAVVFCLVVLIMVAGLVMLGWSVMPQLREAIVTNLATHANIRNFQQELVRLTGLVFTAQTLIMGLVSRGWRVQIPKHQPTYQWAITRFS